MGLLLGSCGQEPTSDAPSMAQTETVPDETVEAPAPDFRESGTTYCDLVDRRLTNEDCEDLERTYARAEDGTAAFNVPDTLKRGKPVTIQLSLGFRNNEPPPPSPEPEAEATGSPGDRYVYVPATAGQTPLEAIAGRPGSAQTYSPIVGRFMRAELKGEGFAIKALDKPEQTVTPRTATSWSWRVTPQTHGAHALTLTTVVIGVTGDGKRYELLPTRHIEPVTITRSFGQATMDTIKDLPTVLKLLTAVLTGATALLVAFWGFRKALRKPGDDDAPPPSS